MSLLGIDIGTTGCKAGTFAEDGLSLSTAYREYPTEHPRPGWAQLDAASVWQAVRDVIGQAVANAPPGDPPTALCVSSMGEAMVPVAGGKIIGPSILGSDVRGGEYVDRLRERINPERFYRINPNVLSAAYSMPKLCWVRAHQPDLYARAEHFLLWGDLVMYMLGCGAVTSFSHANRTLLFDLHAETWSSELIELCSLDADKLPHPLPGGAVAGELAPGAASELGLPAGVKVVVGGHDQCCNALGAGAVRAGQAVCGIGSFECIAPVYDRVPDAARMLSIGLNVEHHVLPGLYVSFLYNQAGTLVKWFRDTFAAGRPGEHGATPYEQLAREMPSQPTNLLTLPYFEPTGSPGFVADAAGAILGLHTDTTRGEVLKSIMESATFYFVEPLADLASLGADLSELVATGGGARSDAWMQIHADVLGVPMHRPGITECGVLGAAMLAGLGTGRFASPDQAVERFVAIDRTFAPDPGRHARYAQRAALYRQVLPTLHELLRTNETGRGEPTA